MEPNNGTESGVLKGEDYNLKFDPPCGGDSRQSFGELCRGSD
jgi:hypothetical protein